MKWLAVAAILAVTATVCQAEERSGWAYIGGSVDESSNMQIEVKTASIESINSNTVRAVFRLVREKPENRVWNFNPKVASVEVTTDFDCDKPRYKTIQEVRVSEDGYRLTMKQDTIPTYESANPTDLIGMTRTFVCKSEGKFK